MKSAHQQVNQTSGKVEFYTDPKFVDAARLVMGSIDLDPASSEIANRTVKADRFFTKEDDGLKQQWSGRVWMNHPFSKTQNAEWIKKLVLHFLLGDISEALCICYASTSEKWFQPLMQFPQCFLSPRTNYFSPDGVKLSGVTKGSVVTYLGNNTDRFRDAFKQFGTVKVIA